MCCILYYILLYYITITLYYIIKSSRIILGDKDWNWGGCSDNVVFGEKASKQYIDNLETGVDERAIVNLHNNEAGRRV